MNLFSLLTLNLSRKSSFELYLLFPNFDHDSVTVYFDNMARIAVVTTSVQNLISPKVY